MWYRAANGPVGPCSPGSLVSESKASARRTICAYRGIGFVSSLGAATREAERLESAQTLVTARLEQVRLSASGVSLDEEMVDLMRFQRAYQAAARIISVVDEMLDALIKRMI